MMTIEQQIFNQAILYPDKIAVKSGKDTCTYKELVSKTLKIYEYLVSFPTYQKGKTLILSAGKQIEFVYTYFAAHLAGIIVVPIDPDTNPTRLKYIIEATHPYYIIGFDKKETEIPKISLKEIKEMTKGILDYPTIEIIYPKVNEVADILFTTGTTGIPKGVPLTYANEAAAARNINTYIGNKTEDVELLALPVSHSFGLGRLRCCLSNGQTIILLGSFVNVKRIFRTIEEEQVAGFTMVPASWKFLQKMSGNQISNYGHLLKYIELGSAYLSEDDKQQLAGLLPNTRIAMHYGLTEASRSAFMEFHSDQEKLSSVGKAAPFTDIKIFDENGDEVPIGTEGEICVKGEHVTVGYLNVDNQELFYDDGYFRTGDSGCMDNDGFIYLKSRIKELINVGGKKVAPSEVDEQILNIKGVKDCACTAVKDPEGVLGEVVKAFIVKEEGSTLTFNDIKEALLGQLESYKIPVEYAWIDVVPKTANGKIQRNLLS